MSSQEKSTCEQVQDFYSELTKLRESFDWDHATSLEKKQFRARYNRLKHSPSIMYHGMRFNFSWLRAFALHGFVNNFFSNKDEQRDFNFLLRYAQHCDPELQPEKLVSHAENITDETIAYTDRLRIEAMNASHLTPHHIFDLCEILIDSSTPDYTFPKTIAGPLHVLGESYPEKLILPEIVVNGDVVCSGLVTVGHLTCPRYMSSSLQLGDLVSVNNLILPEYVGYLINLPELTSFHSLVLPKYCKHKLKFNSLPWKYAQKLDFTNYHTDGDILLLQLTNQEISELQSTYPHLEHAFTNSNISGEYGREFRKIR